MDIKVFPSKLNGRVQAVSSKSDVHRALICAAFADRPTEISCNLLSKDIEATIRCLRAVGAEINAKIDTENGSGTISVKPVRLAGSNAERGEMAMSGRKVPSSFDGVCAELFCGESGSTLRFLVPVMAACGLSCRFTGEGKLPNRPMDVLSEALCAHGVRVKLPAEHEAEQACCLPMEISGKLAGGLFALPGDISSQYITGLLLAFPLIGETCELRLTTPLQSAAYVDMTVDTMRRFGVKLERTEEGWRYAPGSTYHSPGQYRSDGDWSNAAFWLCADKLPGNHIEVEGLRADSLQGDQAAAALAEALAKRASAAEQKTGGHLEQNRSDRKTEDSTAQLDCPEKIDASGIPDLVPALTALAVFEPYCTEIVHAERLRLKECDRLAALCNVFGKLGAKIEERLDGLVIFGGGTGQFHEAVSEEEAEKFPEMASKEEAVHVPDTTSQNGAGQSPEEISYVVVDGHNDHRIVMAAAIAASSCRFPVVIRGAEAVQKSYPHFFADFRKLGGRADVIDLR